jgi:hypothetical protein
MVGESDEPDSAAARLEAALERIAAAAARRASAPSSTEIGVAEIGVSETRATAVAASGMAPAETGTSVGPELAARLDGLIERLRDALAVRAS